MAFLGHHDEVAQVAQFHVSPMYIFYVSGLPIRDILHFERALIPFPKTQTAALVALRTHPI
jgi:hypothetical protein